MSFLKKNVIAVHDEFENRRRLNESEANMRLAQVYDKIPEIIDIDNQLSKTGTEIMAVAMQGKDGLKERLDEVKAKNLALQEKRCALLVANGFDSNYTDIKYRCELCNDYGFADGKMCKCYRAALVEKQLESSGIGNLLKTQSFDSFSLEYYEDKGEMERLVNYLKDYIRDFDKDKENLLFVGGTGLGKTHLSTSVARELIERGYNVVYETAQNIFSDFDKDRFRDRFDEDAEILGDRYLEADLLIIDDLGVEMVSGFTKACLYNIINTRLNKNLPIIASTNLKGAEIQKLYDDRITSRLFGDFTIKKFVGSDIRKLK
ncbi:MAG: ATP-binding protein [Clostridia bacterium]|nr:ATP-binding protein [Clostridia bacterium]MBQ7907847.1 ATP-binding protein [Clostridia bacterium]